ncbi:hypothetical protein [Massilia sp. AB1]|uniref:hypothetical protein n=1 Tax=Massilia sp. AB1 TaxID=2823371 RepID=UPI001B823F66|nr:hypothetical protein [Massilia sp. AB1]MBQ5939479.1 hypothetical protein [Massilia sp. AB1]
MKHTLWAAIGALLAAPLAAQPQRAADPADPGAAVAPLVYESVIATPPVQDAATPDKRWRAANDTVGGQPGHGHAHGAPAAPAPVDHSKHHHSEGKR